MSHLKWKPRPPSRAARDHRQGRLFGDHLHARVFAIDGDVQVRRNRPLQILLAAKSIGTQSPLSAVIEIGASSDRVDAQAVNVVAVEPKRWHGNEKAAPFVAAIVEDGACPIRDASLPRIGVSYRCVRRSTRAVLVLGESARAPVEDNADTVLMQRIDEEHEVLRRSVRALGAKRGHLVAPRGIKGVLHDRINSTWVNPVRRHVLGQPRRQLSIAEQPTGNRRAANPRAEVDFVDRLGAARASACRVGSSSPHRTTRSRAKRYPLGGRRGALARQTGRPCRRRARVGERMRYLYGCPAPDAGGNPLRFAGLAPQAASGRVIASGPAGRTARCAWPRRHDGVWQGVAAGVGAGQHHINIASARATRASSSTRPTRLPSPAAPRRPPRRSPLRSTTCGRCGLMNRRRKPTRVRADVDPTKSPRLVDSQPDDPGRLLSYRELAPRWRALCAARGFTTSS